MTAPAAEPTVEPWITDAVISEAVGIDFTLISRLRRGTAAPDADREARAVGGGARLRSLSSRNAQAVAFGLSWPVGEQYEAWMAGTYGRDLIRAADRAGLPHALACQCPKHTAES